MKQIPLTQGRFSMVDDADFLWLMQRNWRATKRGNTWYASAGRLFGVVHMHRLITNAPKEMQVDHINGDGLDNRRSNLRVCTRAENQGNRKMSKNNAAGYKGVAPYGGKYRSQIKHNGKVYHLGYFTDPVEAARAYDAAAKKYHGEFAKLNFE
jgi:hypothetical protein